MSVRRVRMLVKFRCKCDSNEANKCILQSHRATANFHPHMLATRDHWCGLLKCTDSPEYRRPASCLFNNIESYDSCSQLERLRQEIGGGQSSAAAPEFA